MSGTLNIRAGSLIRKRRDGQIGSGNSTVVTGGGIGANGTNVATVVLEALSDIFEVVNKGLPNQYLRCKLPFGGDFEVQAFTDSGVVGGSRGFAAVEFADPIDLDATIDKDFICGLITANTTINLNNTVDGDAGMIKVVIDETGGYSIALGTMFTEKLGDTDLVTDAGTKNYISWRMAGTDIVYTIAQVV
jgi:hypothetical protein